MKTLIVVVLVSFIVALSTVSLMFFVVGVNVTVHTPVTTTTTTTTKSTCQRYIVLSSATLYASKNNVSTMTLGLTTNDCGGAAFTVGTLTLTTGAGLTIRGNCACSQPLANGANTLTYSFDTSQVYAGQTVGYVLQDSGGSITGSQIAQ